AIAPPDDALLGARDVARPDGHGARDAPGRAGVRRGRVVERAQQRRTTRGRHDGPGRRHRRPHARGRTRRDGRGLTGQPRTRAAMNEALLYGLAAAAAVAILIFLSAVRVVAEYERGVIF